jgi:hypothetical protein
VIAQASGVFNPKHPRLNRQTFSQDFDLRRVTAGHDKIESA